MITVELSQVEEVYCYALPMNDETHYILHISFLWNYNANLDAIVIKTNEQQTLTKEGEMGSIMLDVSSYINL
jgi:hypothetical protein